MEELVNSQKLSQIPRFSCSDVAGITGYHPWQVNTVLLEKYVYQDLEDLRLLDAKNLDVEIFTAEDEINLLVNKLDEEDRKRLKLVEQKIQLNENMDSTAKAHEFLREITSLMKEESVLKRMSSAEQKLVEEEYLGKVRKGYGIKNENSALDKYECLTGFSVVERNMEFIRLSVMPLPAPEPEEEADVDKTNVFSTLLSASRKMSKEQGALSRAAAASSSSAAGAKKRRRQNADNKPSFFLIGKVDGVSHQLDMSAEDPALWAAAKIVVEMKSRLSRISSPPPIYEQIQLVCYMVILDCSHGDLVQAIAQQQEARLSSNKPPQLTIREGEIHYDDDFSISRVSLHGPPYFHSKHWHEIIVPRLRVFREAVVALRADDGLRYAYLLGSEAEKLEILYQLCPYFEPVGRLRSDECSSVPTEATLTACPTNRFATKIHLKKIMKQWT